MRDNTIMQNWISVKEAQDHILANIRPQESGSQQVALRDTLGRVLAADIIAPFNVPGFDNSGMDGIACRYADLSDGAILQMAGSAFAGNPYESPLKSGQCARIMTGARIPEGADTVVPQEDININDKQVTVTSHHYQFQLGAHIRQAGEDLKQGAVALDKGTLCYPAQVGLMASLGVIETQVRRRLRVAFFSTGDELKSLGEPLVSGEIYDSNRYTIFGMLSRMGMEALDWGKLPDCPQTLGEAMEAAKRHADVLITSGGVSVGQADYIRPVLKAHGEILFWKVAMRPGRPLAYGKLGDVDFFGLPGNPVSVMVCFYQFVAPALWKRAGRRDIPLPILASAKTTAPLRKSAGRREYQRGILHIKNGEYWVSPTGDQGSGILSSMTRANCFIDLDESYSAVAAGDVVPVQVFEGVI